MTHYQIALVTHPELQGAKDLAKILVEKNLCACVNIIKIQESIFKFQGKICQSSEYQMIIKTNKGLLEDLEKEIALYHPYEVPEFIAVPVSCIGKDYKKWLDESVARS